DSLATLQIRLPAVVIGGGLTAIDTATEVQAYYISQVEKTLHRYETLANEDRIEAWLTSLNDEARLTLEEFLEHGRAVRSERERARLAGEPPDFIRLIRAWGGVTIVYRRSMNESPAYLRNHEEIIKAMEEGLYYIEGLEPVRAELDRFDHVEHLVCRNRHKKDGRWLASGKETRLPARAILVAAGTFPNTIYEQEFPGTFKCEHNHFLPHVTHKQGMQPVQVAEHCKAAEFGPFTSYDQSSHQVSFVGDAHPVFHGSVVKAIASATRSYPEITTGLGTLEYQPDTSPSPTAFLDAFDDQITPRVSVVNSEHPAVVELWVRAPLAARNYHPGQFFRLQTFETAGIKFEDTRLQIPLQTVSGAGTRGHDIRLFLLRYGATAKLAEQLKPGEPLVLMGPNGAPTPIHDDKTVLVITGSWGAAVMLDLGRAWRARGNRVLYFAFYDICDDVYCQDELEAAADQIVWVTARGMPIPARRPQDLSVAGNDAIELLTQYHRGNLESSDATMISLAEVDEIMVMGSTGLLSAFQQAMRGQFDGVFHDHTEVIGTVGSPMQCMMKGVCAQCLQWQVDPDSGERTRAVFSCAMQEQPLMWIDVDNLSARQRQNQLQDALTNLWVNRILEKAAL
ncbi:MAG: pyridine nucleotide-disulfide oxidoreductase, partial [Gammaproteobacteria bacterium]|nr:pyridine nucleotide-disulfide oxidoreductase [Gammaproteobacteria bacterium]